MHLCYFDESGDAGHPALVNTPTRFFVLTCVFIEDKFWRVTLDSLISLRSDLRRQYGLRVRGEIKASDFHRGKGAFKSLGLSEATRMQIYRRVLQYQRETLPHVGVFSVAIDKARVQKRDTNLRETAWQYALQRVDSLLKPNSDSASDRLGCIYPDEGHGDMIRTLLRRVRRHQRIKGYFGGVLSIPVDRIIEDPSDRRSNESYFIQLADWNALACHRSAYIDPTGNLPADLWDELGDRRLLDVNKLTGGAPGIVRWPRP